MSTQPIAERVKNYLAMAGVGLGLLVVAPFFLAKRIVNGPELDEDGKPVRSLLYTRFRGVPAFLVTGLWVAAVLPAAMGVFLGGPFGQSQPEYHYPARCAADDDAAWHDKFEQEQGLGDMFPLPWRDPHSPECKQELADEDAAQQARRPPETVGDRVDAALAYGLLAAALGAAALYRRWRRGEAWWSGSIMEKASGWSLAVSVGLLIGFGSSMLPHVLFLEPHEPWSWAFFAGGFAILFAVKRERIAKDFREARSVLRVLLQERRRLGSFRAAIHQETTPELEARLAEATGGTSTKENQS